MEQRIIVRYSEAFKRQVVEQLERGEFSSLEDARRRYGIKGSMTVCKWVRRFGRNHLLAKVVRVETPDEARESDALRRQVRELESALAKTRCRELLNEAFLEIACERCGESVDDFKKKAAARLSDGQAGRESGR